MTESKLFERILMRLCDVGLHNNEKMFTEGSFDYYECKRCGYRHCKKHLYGHSSINRKWINSGKKQ